MQRVLQHPPGESARLSVLSFVLEVDQKEGLFFSLVISQAGLSHQVGPPLRLSLGEELFVDQR
jgi:hypothetical protein